METPSPVTPIPSQTSEPIAAAKPVEAKPARKRRNSGALLEERAPDWLDGAAVPAVVRKLHEFVYPQPSNWYWYRRGKVSHSSLGSKYKRMFVLLFIMAFAGSGLLMPICLHVMAAGLRALHDASTGKVRNETFFGGLDGFALATETERPDFYPLAGMWWYVLLQCFLSGCFTLGSYYWAGSQIIDRYYVGQKDKPEAWKCQPENYLTSDRWREEKILGCTNAFVAGFYGTGVYFLHLNYPFLKLYYDSGPSGLAYFFLSALVTYFWIDFYSYWAHRFLHTPFMYKNVHKVHHRYIHPTPFSAFALHPIEFFVFQSAGLMSLAFIPTHIAAYLCVVVFIAYHNQIDHSGVDFEGELPWLPSTKYHDDHHKYFHLNFGLHFVAWDWLGGTLRAKSRSYGEKAFVGHQDTPIADDDKNE